LWSALVEAEVLEGDGFVAVRAAAAESAGAAEDSAVVAALDAEL